MNLEAFVALFGDDLQPEVAFGTFGLSGRVRRRLQATRPPEGPTLVQALSSPTTSVSGKACSQT